MEIKMKKKLLKLTAMLLVVIMSVSLLVGCGAKNESSNVSNDENTGVSAESNSGEVSSVATDEDTLAFEHDANLNEPGTEPVCKEKIKLTIGIVQNTNVQDYNTNYYTQMLEEACNVDLEFVLFPATEAAEKLRLMCAAGGADLPDIILMKDLNDKQVEEYGSSGMFIDLEPYFENSSYYLAEGIESIKENNGIDILENIRVSDGHIYSVPHYAGSITNPPYARLWLYQPWLDALELEEPKTTEEFENVLRAFKTQDPNGNGIADEIPMLGAEMNKGIGGNLFEGLMGGFIRVNRSRNYMDIVDGKVTVCYNQDAFKEGIKWINSLVEEKLVNPVSFTQDQESFKAIVNQEGDQIVGSFVYLSTSFIPASHASKTGWMLLEPLTGPDGTCTTSFGAVVPNHRGFITKNCKNQEAAFRVLDIMAREDFSITSRWGIQGENWDYVDDVDLSNPALEGKTVNLTQTFGGYPASIYEYVSCWNQPQNNHWSDVAVAIRSEAITAGYYASDMEEGSVNWWLGKNISAYTKAGGVPITKFPYTTEEQEEVNELLNGLNTYIGEKIGLWCTGAADIEEEWEDYLATLESLGLSRVLEITNEAYSRME